MKEGNELIVYIFIECSQIVHEEEPIHRNYY